MPQQCGVATRQALIERYNKIKAEAQENTIASDASRTFETFFLQVIDRPSLKTTAKSLIFKPVLIFPELAAVLADNDVQLERSSVCIESSNKLVHVSEEVLKNCLTDKVNTTIKTMNTKVDLIQKDLMLVVQTRHSAVRLQESKNLLAPVWKSVEREQSAVYQIPGANKFLRMN